LTELFAMHGRLLATPGQADALAGILLEAAAVVGRRPDCHLYMVSREVGDDEALWVTELWASEQAHDASLDDDDVRTLIARARPLVAGMDHSQRLRPVGGAGVPSS
jgi:quinol monooxygenase YgiN